MFKSGAGLSVPCYSWKDQACDFLPWFVICAFSHLHIDSITHTSIENEFDSEKDRQTNLILICPKKISNYTCPFGWRIPAVVLLNNPTSPLLSAISHCIVGWQINKSRRRRSPMFSLHNRDLWQSVSQSQPKHQGWVTRTVNQPHSKTNVILNTSLCPGHTSHNTSILKDSVTL